MRTWIAREDQPALTPRPSLPITIALGPAQFTSSIDNGAPGMAAYKVTLCAAIASSTRTGSGGFTNGRRNRDPADARRHFGLNGLTVVLRNTTPDPPNASVARTIAPAFPGS